jgi:hypothetical protein
MNIDPSGNFLYAANQNTEYCRIPHPAGGGLRFSTLVNTPTPVDVEFGSIVQLSFPGTRR